MSNFIYKKGQYFEFKRIKILCLSTKIQIENKKASFGFFKFFINFVKDYKKRCAFILITSLIFNTADEILENAEEGSGLIPEPSSAFRTFLKDQRFNTA